MACIAIQKQACKCPRLLPVQEKSKSAISGRKSDSQSMKVFAYLILG